MSTYDNGPGNTPAISPADFAPQRLVEAPADRHATLRHLSFQFMQDGFAIVDAKGFHVDVNPAFCEMTGYSEQELIGATPVCSYWPPEDEDSIQCAFARTLCGESTQAELLFQRKSGERFPVIVNPFAIRDHSGNILYYAASVREVTQEVANQAALLESEQRYRALFENAGDAIVILQDEKIIDCNERVLQVTGRTREQILSSPTTDLFPPKQSSGDSSRRYFAEKVAAARLGDPQRFEWTGFRSGGEVMSTEVTLTAFRLGNTWYTQAIMRDITQRMKLEEALTQSEQQYRTLFESAGDGIIIMQDERVLDCNQRVLDLYDIDREELVGQPNPALFPPLQPNGQCSREFIAEKIAALSSGNPQTFPWVGTKLDDTPIQTEVTLTTFMLDGKECTQSLIRDVTARRQLEDALRDSELRYRTIFENAGDGIVILEGEKVLDCNQRFLEMYCMSREDMGNLSVPDYSLSPPRQPNGQTSREFFAEKIAALRSGNPQTFPWAGTRLDGTPIQTEVTLTTFMLDGKGCTQSLIRDVTARRQLENALRDSEVRYRTLFESAGDAIAIHKDGRTIDCNERLSELYGFSREEILSATTGDFFPPLQPNGQDSREFFREKVEAARAGKPQIYEWHGRKRDGTPIVTEITLTTITLGDEVYEQAIGRDITQRKEMEAALVELNTALEDRVTQRTNELESAYAELLERNAQYRALAARLTQAENEERRRIAQVLHDNHQQLIVAAKFRVEHLQVDAYSPDVNEIAHHVLQILDQALEASRSLTMELAPPILYSGGLVHALRWLATWMEENYELKVTVAGTMSMKRIPVDVSTLLFQATRELLLNVKKHSGVGRASVSVAADNHELKVTVADEGAGFVVTSTLETPRSFGLFNIRERALLLGGQMDVRSAPGAGTVVQLAFPLPASDGPSPRGVVGPEPGAGSVDRRLSGNSGFIRILVTDDHAASRASVLRVLGNVNGFDIVGEAQDGLDAIEQVRLLKPDVVLMDVTMPRLDGLEATRRITGEFPDIKVIGFSMHASEDVQSQMRAAGAIGYLDKSTPLDELIASIRLAMDPEAGG